jgi:asparagine synthetase B (glutamine-hydrolysing)
LTSLTAIIGLGDGHQPMTDQAGNWISHNGEIFNYIELRSELGIAERPYWLGHQVILAAYRRWGPISSSRCEECCGCGRRRRASGR